MLSFRGCQDSITSVSLSTVYQLGTRFSHWNHSHLHKSTSPHFCIRWIYGRRSFRNKTAAIRLFRLDLDFQHSLWNCSTTENLYSLKSWMWCTLACVVHWAISNALLNYSWLTCFTRMCNWNYWHKHHALWFSEVVKLNRERKVQSRIH